MKLQVIRQFELHLGVPVPNASRYLVDGLFFLCIG